MDMRRIGELCGIAIVTCITVLICAACIWAAVTIFEAL